MSYKNLIITTGQAEDILFDLFRIKGTASSLSGEVDFNFKIKVESNTPNKIINIIKNSYLINNFLIKLY